MRYSNQSRLIRETVGLRAKGSNGARNGSVDFLRFLGAVGIILFHMNMPLGWVGLAALPMFVTTLVYFGAGKPMAHHVKRLLLPWGIWCGVYGVMKILQSTVEGQPVAAEFEWWMLLTGTSLHLWFLPFCVLFLVLYRPLQAWGSPWAQYGIAATVSLASLWAANSVVLPVPVQQWATVIPAAFVGLLMAKERDRVPVLLVCCSVMGLLIVLGYHAATWQILISCLVLLAAFLRPVRDNGLSRLCAGLAFGMYLVHPAVIAAADYIIDADTWAAFALVTAVSAVATYLIRKAVPAAV